MQTYSRRKPEVWNKKEHDDVFDMLAAPTAKQQFVESWLRHLPDAPRPPLDSDSSIEVLRQESGKPASLEKRSSCSSIIDLIDPFSRDQQKKFSVKKPKLPTTYKIFKKMPLLQASAFIRRQMTKSFTNTVESKTADLTNTDTTESITSASRYGETGMDCHETEESETSYTYTWVTASTTNSSTDNVENKYTFNLKKDELKDSSPSIHMKKVKKKVLNSTVKKDARDLESVNFSRNLSPIQNCDVHYDALRQQQLEESTPYKSRESPVSNYQNQKKLQKKGKKPLSSTAVYLSGVNIEEKFQDMSPICDDGVDKIVKKKHENDACDSLVDNDTVVKNKEVKGAHCALTSTPVLATSKNLPPKLHIELSSLGSASSCSDEIILLRKSDAEINSEEIVAKSYSSEVDLPDLKDICIESPPAKSLVKNSHLRITDRSKTNKRTHVKNGTKPDKSGKGKRKRINKDIKCAPKHRRKFVGKNEKHPKITSKREYKWSRKAKLTVCPLSLAPTGPMTKPTGTVYIQPANKEFWDRVKTYRTDPLTTLKPVKTKQKK